MNSVNITGRLTKDPVASETHEKKPVTSFSIAYNEPYGQKAVSYFDVTAFGKTADFARTWLKKGTKVEVTGRLKQERYTSRDGNMITKYSIIASELGFAEGKQENQQPPTEEAKDEFVPVPTHDLDELPFA